MKKILSIFSVLALSQINVMAYVFENETANVKTLESQGYSDSTLQIVDLFNTRTLGRNRKYVSYYNKKQNGKLGRAYQRLKIYVDPVQDDGDFGNHQIQFSNTWMGDETKYASDKEKNQQIENL